LIGADEVAFLPDLQLFLGRQDIVAGRVPSAALDDWVEVVNSSLNDGELSLQKDVCERSMKLYRKTRPKASLESIRRSKLLNCDSVLPVFAGCVAPFSQCTHVTRCFSSGTAVLQAEPPPAEKQL
jgi:hypothetical protein